MGYEIKIDSWLEDAATLIRGIDVSAVADAAENLIRVRNANGTIFWLVMVEALLQQIIWLWIFRRLVFHPEGYGLK